MFSAEFRQEMQKEIERNLNLRNEIRHRIITADSSTNSDKKKSQEGLKYLVSERETGGLASLSTSTSSSTNSTTVKQEQEETKTPVLRPANFLTGFRSETAGIGIGGVASASFITRGIPPKTFSTTPSKTEIPSISTRFFQRLASRLDDYTTTSS